MFKHVFLFLVSFFSSLVFFNLVVFLSGCESDNPDLPVITDPDEPILCPNPIAQGPIVFGVNGTDSLYKPESDSDGNVVVLLDSVFQGQFDDCKIKTGANEYRNLNCIDNAPWTQIPYSCFSNPVGNNPPRQTWRADIKCDQVEEIEIVCSDECQSVTFTVMNEDINKVCERWG